MAEASQWLAPGGHVLVETSDQQAGSLAASIAGSGLVPQTLSDPQVGATVLIGSRPAVPE